MKVWIYTKDDQVMGVYLHQRRALQDAFNEVYQVCGTRCLFDELVEGDKNIWELITPEGDSNSGEIFCTICVERTNVNLEK